MFISNGSPALQPGEWQMPERGQKQQAMGPGLFAHQASLA